MLTAWGVFSSPAGFLGQARLLPAPCFSSDLWASLPLSLLGVCPTTRPAPNRLSGQLGEHQVARPRCEVMT